MYQFSRRLFRAKLAVVSHLEERMPFHDPLRVHFGCLYSNTTFAPNKSAFDNLKSIGFDLIRNDSLRRSITALYAEH
jgi:hypothetical protein